MKAQTSTEVLALIGIIFVISSLVAYFFLGSGLNTSLIEDTFPVITSLFGRTKTLTLVKPTELEQVIVPAGGAQVIYPEIITQKQPSKITYSILENGFPKQNCVLEVYNPQDPFPLNTRTRLIVKEKYPKTDKPVEKYLVAYSDGTLFCINPGNCCLSEGYYDSKIEIVADSKTYSDVKKKGVASSGPLVFSLVYPTSLNPITVNVGNTVVLTPRINFNRPIKSITLSIVGSSNCLISVTDPLMNPSTDTPIRDSSGNVQSITIKAKTSCAGETGCCLTPATYQILYSGNFDGVNYFYSELNSVKVNP